MSKKLVKITWKDIASVEYEEGIAWHTKEQLCTEAENLYQAEYVTIGVLAHENNDYVVVAATYSYDDMYADASMIPKSVITKIETLCIKD